MEFLISNKKGMGYAEVERHHKFHLLPCFCFLDLKTEAHGV